MRSSAVSLSRLFVRVVGYHLAEPVSAGPDPASGAARTGVKPDAQRRYVARYEPRASAWLNRLEDRWTTTGPWVTRAAEGIEQTTAPTRLTGDRLGHPGLDRLLGSRSRWAWHRPVPGARSNEFITPGHALLDRPAGPGDGIDSASPAARCAGRAMERRAHSINRGRALAALRGAGAGHRNGAGRTWCSEGGAFTNRHAVPPGTGGTWQVQAAVITSVAEWTLPDRMLVSRWTARPARWSGCAWKNHPAPLSLSLRLQDAQDLQMSKSDCACWRWHVPRFRPVSAVSRLGSHLAYGDRFIALHGVTCTLGFRSRSPAWADCSSGQICRLLERDAAPALFMLWLTAAGIWFVREVSALSRHSRLLYRFATAWSLLGFRIRSCTSCFSSPAAFQAAGTCTACCRCCSSFGLCIWAWRKGETYAGWIALGFLPLHLALPVSGAAQRRRAG